MKKLICILLLLISFTSYSQVVEDTIKIPRSELLQVFQAIDNLTYQDSVKSELIRDLRIQVRNYQLLEQQSITILDYKDKQINILNEQVNLYDDRLKQVDKWYRKPWVGFILGCATITTSSWIIYNIK